MEDEVYSINVESKQLCEAKVKAHKDERKNNIRSIIAQNIKDNEMFIDYQFFKNKMPWKSKDEIIEIMTDYSVMYYEEWFAKYQIKLFNDYKI